MNKIFLYGAISLVIILLNIDITVMSVVLAPIAHSLHLQVHQLSWAFNIYLIIFAALIVIGGKLGDRYGRTMVLMFGLCCFAIASFLCGSAHSLMELLIARSILACGAALIWPNITVFLYQQFPPAKRAVALSFLTSLVGIGLSVGPIVGGMVGHWLNWHWIFWLNVPLVVIAMFILLFVKSVGIARNFQPLPILNSLLLGISVAGVAYVINTITQPHGRAVALILSPCIVIIFGCYLRLEKNSLTPLLALSLFKNVNFKLACIYRFLSVPVIYTTLFVVGLYLQQDLHLSVLNSGLMFLAMTVPIGVASPIVGKLIQKYQPQRVLCISAITAIIASIWFIAVAQYDSVFALAMPLALLGVSFALSSPAVLAIGLGVAKEQDRGAASGLFYMISLLSGTLFVAINTAQIMMHGAGTITYDGIYDCFLLLASANGIILLILLFSRLIGIKKT